MFRKLYKCFLIVLGLSVSFATTVAADDSITIIKSTDSEFHFTVSIDPLRLSRVEDTNSVEHSYRSVQFAIPYGAKVSVEQVDYRKTVITTDAQATVSPQPYELAGPIEVRGVQLMMLRLFPITSTGCYTEADVHLFFEGGAIGVAKNASVASPDPLLKSFVANYDQSTAFTKQRTAQKLSQVAGPFDGVSNWVKIDVNKTGLYRITGAELESAGISLSSLSINDIHLYSGGGLPVPVDNSVARPMFEEVAIQVVDDGDNVFEASDYMLFFGESVDRWVYADGLAPAFSNHPYSALNVYWLTTSISAPHRWSTRSVAVGGAEDTVIQDYSRRVRVETDNMLRKLRSGRTFDYYSWLWTNEPSLDFFVGSPGRIAGDTAQLYLAALTSDPTGPGDPEGFVNMSINGLNALNKICNQRFCTYKAINLVDGLNSVHLDMWGSGSSEPYFDNLELAYQSSLLPLAGQLDLVIDPSTLLARMDVIDNVGNQFTLLDISDPLHPVELTGSTRGGGTISFASSLSPARSNRFLLTDLSQLLNPLAIRRTTPVDLYTTDQQVDLIIVAADNLVSSMDEYIEYRQSQGYAIKLVSVSDIMDNFGFGLYDPAAIRDFLKFTFDNYPAPAPSGVLFVGDGTYDYLDVLGTGVQNFVPPFQLQVDDPTSDDNYVFFGDYGVLDSDTSYVVSGRGFDMHTGRWPVRSRSEVNTLVAKIKQYESASTYGPWRNNITLVADDEHGHADNETIHTIQTTQLDKDHIPPSFNRNRVYLWDYPFVNKYKPAVNDVIVKSINDGTLIVNYIGHGNPDVWAHERVFTRDADLPRLKNLDKLPLIFAASCAIGFFDDPQREGMAEEMLAQPTGGCIATISATRLVYSSENAAFNRQVFDILLTDAEVSISEALYLGKLERQYRFGSIPVPVINDRAYAYFGDPLLKLGMPRLEVEFGAVPDSLTALSTIHIDGRVRAASGALFAADGILHVDVFDTEREKTYRLVNSNGVITQKIDYSVNGPAVFRGTASITAGEFSFDFITPLDIGYGGQGARITTYAEFENIDGIGLIDSLSISSQVTPSNDSSGPAIVVSFPGQTDFVSGDAILPGSQLNIAISDSSGINLTGGLGHDITLIVDGRSEDVVNLSPAFAYNQDDFTSGELVHVLDNVSPGHHSFKIKAWDNANNSSTMTFSAEILASSAPAIVELLNYPNPMQESTRFSYRLTQPVSRLTLEIYTLSGRKIKSFDTNPMATGYFDDIVWYGDDYAGDRVATGVYIYKAVATPETGGEPIESFGKVVVVN